MVGTSNLEIYFESYYPRNTTGPFSKDLVICFANLNNIYKDCVVFSGGSAGRGLFNYIEYSFYIINSSEKVSAVGERANIDFNRWWKSYTNGEKYN